VFESTGTALSALALPLAHEGTHQTSLTSEPSTVTGFIRKSTLPLNKARSRRLRISAPQPMPLATYFALPNREASVRVEVHSDGNVQQARLATDAASHQHHFEPDGPLLVECTARGKEPTATRSQSRGGNWTQRRPGVAPSDALTIGVVTSIAAH